MTHQSRLFDDTAALPLFSGTPQQAQLDTFDPAPAAQQESLASCPVCLDTGSADGHPCWCEAADLPRPVCEGWDCQDCGDSPIHCPTPKGAS